MACKQLLGDRIEQALETVGITQERVELWLGKACGCTERKERFNQLHAWASRVVQGKIERAKEYLQGIIE